MIVKNYTLYCDKCGAKINTWQTSSAEKAVSLEKKSFFDGAKITKRVNGAYHIECADCAKENNGR